ncbi:MAG: RNA 3'-terminal phosphate cyclase, partial [Anaerolineae bacterium]
MEGATLGSQALSFVPQHPPQAGSYTFDVNDATPTGSAGSVNLVLQAILLPLALASDTSNLTLYGGTTVPMSPSALYVEKVYLPSLFEMGIRAKFTHAIWGFYPGGGGQVQVEIKGGTALRGFDFTRRGALLRVEGLAFAAKLPSHIPQRMTNRARSILKDAGFDTQIAPQHVPSPGLGTGLFLCARYEFGQAGFLSLGRKGLPSEEVAEIGCRELLEHHCTGAAVDPHMGDQLVLPFALAKGGSEATVSEITRHLLTNVWVAHQFGFSHVTVVGEEGEPGLLQAID